MNLPVIHLLIMLEAAVSSLAAVDNAPATAFEPPKKYGAERYLVGWERNPFAIPTPPSAPPLVESQFKDLAIKSVFGPKDSPIFSLVNTKTHERMRISMNHLTQDGVELKSFSLAENRRETTIEIAKGSETATLKYAVDYVPPAASAAQGARPGMPATAGRIPIPQIGAASVNPAANRHVIGQPAGNANLGTAGANAVVAGSPNATTDVAARRRTIPNVADMAGAAPGGTMPQAGLRAAHVNASKPGSPTITLGTNPTSTPPPAQTQGHAPPGEISPPIVRPPPSIYLDGSQSQ
ncbi:MAG: hypothetical protein RIS79_3780 [Verrucomicrobiota bacterium]